MLLCSYSYILDSKSNKQAFKKLFQKHIISAEPFAISQKYCLTHISTGATLPERQAVCLNRGSVKSICSLAFCTQGKVSKNHPRTPMPTATHCFPEATRNVSGQGARGRMQQGTCSSASADKCLVWVLCIPWRGETTAEDAQISFVT